MATFAAVIAPRTRDLGGFSVRRILPAIGRKTVGPFIFFDHMGPASFEAGQGMDVRPHPHIGLATVTFLFEGSILHRDSLGSVQVIKPGDVNWMTAGSGIVHSERTPPDVRQQASRISGIQCWVALPREHEEIAASFDHHPEASLPTFEIGSVKLRLLVGSAFDRQSPVKAQSDIVYLDVQMPAGSLLTMPAGARELGAYVVSGDVEINAEKADALSLVVGHVGQDFLLETKTPARLMLIGGLPMQDKREIWWNFVSTSKERIEVAKTAWAERRFPLVPGDEIEFTPLPESR